MECGERLRRRAAGKAGADEEPGEEADPEQATEEMKKELEKFGLDDYISIPVSLVLLILGPSRHPPIPSHFSQSTLAPLQWVT